MTVPRSSRKLRETLTCLIACAPVALLAVTPVLAKSSRPGSSQQEEKPKRALPPFKLVFADASGVYSCPSSLLTENDFHLTLPDTLQYALANPDPEERDRQLKDLVSGSAADNNSATSHADSLPRAGQQSGGCPTTDTSLENHLNVDLQSIAARENRPTNQPTFDLRLPARIATAQARLRSFKAGTYNPSENNWFYLEVLDRQKIYVFQDGQLQNRSIISSGRPGHETPTGLFHATSKEEHHTSTLYGSDMPFFQRYDEEAVGMHEENVSSPFRSHGCTRLPMNKAQAFYKDVPKGSAVIVVQSLDPATQKEVNWMLEVQGMFTRPEGTEPSLEKIGIDSAETTAAKNGASQRKKSSR